MAIMRKPSQELLNILSRNIRRIRQQQNLSQEELAERCGYHRTYIGSVERGERNVSLSTLEVLGNTLKVTIQQLIEESESSK